MEQLRARLGPWPVWVWLALITGVGLAWYLYEQHKHPSAAGDQPAPEGTAQVPETVNQTTISVTPPAAPSPSAPVTGGTSSGGASSGGKLLTGSGNGTYKVGQYTGSPADLFNIAKELGMTEAELVKDNPQLKSYVGTGKGIPTGTTIYTKAGQAPAGDTKKTTHPVTRHPSKPKPPTVTPPHVVQGPAKPPAKPPAKHPVHKIHRKKKKAA